MAALGIMAAGIAYEINNPLQIVKELLGLMKDDLGDGKLSEEDLKQFDEVILKVESQLVNGTISVDSKEGQGTTFTVLLPC